MTIQKLKMNEYTPMCGMCNQPKGKGSMYRWIGDITKTTLKICRNCALRELGKKKGKQELEEIDNE